MAMNRRAGECICSCWTRSAGLLQPSTSRASISRRWASTKADAVLAEGTADRDATTSTQDVVDEAVDANGVVEPTDISDSSTSAFGGKFPKYSAWLRQDGRAHKRPTVGSTNWLGGNVPFPLNKSFRPPAPIADKQKQKIYESFARMATQTVVEGSSEQTPRKSETFYVRQLSQAFGLSLDRIRAIIRLKALEHNMVEQASQSERDSVLQHRFMHGMEQALGVSDSRSAVDAYRNAELRVQGEDGKGDKAYRVGLKSHWVLVNEEDPAAVAEVEALKSPTKTQTSADAQQGKLLTSDGKRSDDKTFRVVQANPHSTKQKKAEIKLHMVDAKAPTAASASART